jgi:hypothetical protein
MSTSPVMAITDELVAELEALAGKATPGPWWIDSHGHNMVSESMDHQLVFTADDRMGKAERNKETGNLSHWPNDWDASFIATANPATILALLAERAELKRDANCLRWLLDQGDNAQWQNILRIEVDDYATVRDAINEIMRQDGKP